MRTLWCSMVLTHNFFISQFVLIFPILTHSCCYFFYKFLLERAYLSSVKAFSNNGGDFVVNESISPYLEYGSHIWDDSSATVLLDSMESKDLRCQYSLSSLTEFLHLPSLASLHSCITLNYSIVITMDTALMNLFYV